MNNPDVLALGYKNERGEIVVTDVLCIGFPTMSAEEKADFSRRLSQWAATFRRAKQPLSQPDTPARKAARLNAKLLSKQDAQ